MLYMYNLCLEIQNLLAFGIIGLYTLRTFIVLEVRVEVEVFGSHERGLSYGEKSLKNRRDV